LVKFYGDRLKWHWQVIAFLKNSVRVVIILITLLVSLIIWGVPTISPLLAIGIAILAVALALRDGIPNLLAGLQLAANEHIKAGDYIKLGTGEEGYVTEIGWRNTRLEAPDESIVIVPNRRLVQHTVINYGRPLKKAEQPFHFYSRTHVTELTGLKARNLRELADVLKRAPDSVVYYPHTSLPGSTPLPHPRTVQ
jgi:small-conductance mechanosensitive channel